MSGLSPDPIAPDPITVEVVGNAFLSIAEEMGEALVRAAYSDNIKERRDSSTAIFDERGRTIAQAAHIPIHLGSLLGVVQSVLARYPVETLAQGDMFMGNDPYTAGGTHLPDIVVTAPLFVDGVLRGFVTNLGHHHDFVDRGNHRHIFQEGLRIPPTRVMQGGETRGDVLDLILTNMQFPEQRAGDFRAQFAANLLGIRRLTELFGRYGADRMPGIVDAILDSTERRTRAGIERIPDGTYRFSDVLDSGFLESPARVSVTIEKAGSEITLDFSDNPPQGPHPLNLQLNGMLATSYYALKTLVDPDLAPNEGFYRPIHVIAKAGTIFNCTLPAAVEARTQTCQRVVDLVHGALAEALPAEVTAAHNGGCSSVRYHGIDPRSGRLFGYMETLGGGFGARATKDGLDGVHVHITNTSNLPIEALESTYPLLVKQYELIQDSGGPGKWRGGMGFVRQIETLGGEAVVEANITRTTVPPWGLFGGRPGGLQRGDVYRADGTVESLPGGDGELPRVALGPGESPAISTSGGGGYGDPRERDRELVRRDLREERISRESAVRDYGLEDA
ncbi:MAG: hydantoinase B/oxoprolinase family protein [Chloroflexota bacterium]